VIYANGYTQEELLQGVASVHSNVVEGLKALIRGCKKLEIALTSDASADAFMLVTPDSYNDEARALAVSLWSDDSIKEAALRLNEFQAQPTLVHFLDSLDRIHAPNYIPTTQDILLCRDHTIGIIETVFMVGKMTCRIVDVAGQRGERKKWIHCFEGVTAVIFVVAASEYNQVLAEDETTNRMTESLNLFEEIANLSWFKNSSIVLFLNKSDLFEDQIVVKKVDLKQVFPEYTGGPHLKAAKDCVLSSFIKMDHEVGKEHSQRVIYPHWTCATNTANIEHVFTAVTDALMRRVLHDVGWA